MNILDTKKISIRNAKYAKIGLEDLCDYVGDMSNMTMVEIGSYVGDSTEIFAKRVKKIICIDPWENGYDENDGASSQHDMSIVERQFDELCEKYDNIVKIKNTSENSSKNILDKSIDLVYIDGLHTYIGVNNDIRVWLPKIKDGGYISGHDYGSKHFPDVKTAVDNFAIPDKTFRDSSWIKKI